MGHYIEQLGMQAGENAINGIMGLMLGGINDKRQLKQQEALQNLGIRGSKELTDYQMMKQLEMWKATGPGGMMEQLKKAGLNPGLIYGMGGAGGATTGGGAANISGGHAPTGGREVQDIMGIGIQSALLKAQKENIEAQTENTQADTANKTGVEPDLKRAQTADLLQGIENKKAIEILTKVQTDIANIDKEVQGETANDRINHVAWMAEKAMYEMEHMERTVYMQKATMNDKIDTVRAEYIGAILRNANTRADTALKGAQKINVGQQTTESKEAILNWVKERSVKWESLGIDARKAQVLELQHSLNRDYKDTDQLINVISNAVDGIMQRVPGGSRNARAPF